MGNLKRFFVKCLLLGVPVIVVYAFPVGVLLLGGELTETRTIIRQQREMDTTLVGLAYSNPVKYYKLQSTLESNPEVLVLGTSRVMQIRKEFFHSDVRFYNAGGGISRITQLSRFLEHIPRGQEPKVLIVGLDQNFFNPNWETFENDFEESDFSKTQTPLEIIQHSFKQVYADYTAGKFTLRALLSKEAGKVGLNAVVHSNGFRNDGSYFNGEALEDLQMNPEAMPDFQLRQTFRYIDGGVDRYAYGQEVSGRALEYLRDFLATAKGRNIYVVGFLPPYQHAVAEKMKSMGDRYQYFRELYTDVGAIFKEFSFGFYDFSDITALNVPDTYFIDGDHGSDKAYLVLFTEMLKRDRYLQNYSDLTSLRALLDVSKGISLSP